MDKGRDIVNVQGVHRTSTLYKKAEVLRDPVFHHCHITNITDDPLNISESNKVLCLFEVPQLSCTFIDDFLLIYHHALPTHYFTSLKLV